MRGRSAGAGSRESRSWALAAALFAGLWGGVTVAPGGEALARSRSPSPAPSPAFVRMTAARVVQLQGDIVVLLEDGPQTKLLPIGIGLSEGQAIQLGLSRIVPPRPLTHNLLESVIKTLGSLHRLEIVSLDGKTFIGRLIVKDARGRVHSIDARPSDLIALSVNSKEPVWVEQKVLDKAGIPHPSPARPPVGGGGTPNA